MMPASSPVVKRFLVAMDILAIGLIVGIVVISLPPAGTQSPAAEPVERGTGFDFVDH